MPRAEAMSASAELGIEWRPANRAELRMKEALDAQDATSYFRCVATASLFLPAVSTDLEGDGVTRQRLFTLEIDGVHSLVVFTNPEAALGVSGADAVTRLGYRELAEGWPETSSPLALNPNTPIGFLGPVDVIIRRALGFEGEMNEVAEPEATERELRLAVAESDGNLLIDVLVTSTVLAPTIEPASEAAGLGTPDFPWRRVDGALSLFTSEQMLVDELGPTALYVDIPFLTAARQWPADEPLVINPGSSLEMTIEPHEIVALVNWAVTAADSDVALVPEAGGSSNLSVI